MKINPGLFFLLIASTSFGQVPSLIFHSGFEPNTDTTLQGSVLCDLIGIDNSVSPPNDWVNDLENHPNIGNFRIWYESGNDTMRLAEMVSDPTNALNNVLMFWIKHPNVSGIKGRIQGSIDNNTGITNLYYSIRMYLPSDFNLIMNMPAENKWLTLMEFWNNVGTDPYPFRVTVNLQKIGMVPDSLRLGAHGQVKNFGVWTNIWDTTNTSFAVPIAQWMKLEIHYIEGNNSNGRFKLTVTPDGASPINVLDITNYTHHPSDPSPDGLGSFNPFKLYTSSEIIDSMRTWGGLLNVYWDDFELWKDSTIVVGLNDQSSHGKINIYPNPTKQHTTLEFDNFKNDICILTLYDTYGRLVRTITNITTEKVKIERQNLIAGLYFFQLCSDRQIIGTGKFIITD